MVTGRIEPCIILLYTLLHRLENNKSSISSFFLVSMFNSMFKRKKSALKISIVKFSFYFVCGININWFSANAFFFSFFDGKHTIFLDCMKPIVCFWSVNNSFLILYP